MKLNHEKMLELTAAMPMKQIRIPAGEEKILGSGVYGHELVSVAIIKPYLNRYYAGTFKDGKDLWLHNFLSSDSERHLHSHPFDFETIMLVGKYVEQYRRGMYGEIITRYTSTCEFRNLDGAFERLLQKLNSPIKDAAPLSSIMLGLAGEHRSVDVYDWHRITHAEVNTWTAVIVDHNRLPAWYFMDDDGSMEHRNSSPRDWHKKYNCRPVNGAVIGDNMKESEYA